MMSIKTLLKDQVQHNVSRNEQFCITSLSQSRSLVLKSLLCGHKFYDDRLSSTLFGYKINKFLIDFDESVLMDILMLFK